MKTVELYSGTRKYKGSINILPIHLCGYVYYSLSGNRQEEIDFRCKDCELIETPGGRTRELICLNPKHYNNKKVELFDLTTPETRGLQEQLGKDYEKYVRPASVHGIWKIKRNQGVVVKIV